MKNLLKVILVIGLCFSSLPIVTAQKETVKIYNPQANAKQEIKKALSKAKAEGKHLFIQVGGNWCSWCVLLHKFYTSENEIDSMLNANYVVYLLNYSKENKNLDILADLGYPQRFGFPVIVILDAKGNKIHIQNTVCLEQGRGYDKKKFYEFLKNWSPKALNPETYKK